MHGRGGGLGDIRRRLVGVEKDCREFASAAEGLDRSVTGLAAEVDRRGGGTVTGMDDETARSVGQASVALRDAVAALRAAAEAANRLSGTL